MRDLEEDLKRFKDPIFLGYLNMDLDESPRIQIVAGLLAEYGIIDLVRHFRPRLRFRNLKTWSKVQQGTVLW